MSDDPSVGLTRRDMLKLSALAGAGASLAPLATASVSAAAATTAPTDFNEMTVSGLQGMMASGQAHAVDLVNFYLQLLQTIPMRSRSRKRSTPSAAPATFEARCTESRSC